MQRPDISKKVAFAEGTYNPVAQMGSEEVLASFDKDELDAIQWDSLRITSYNVCYTKLLRCVAPV